MEQITNLWGTMPPYQSAASAQDTKKKAILNVVIIFTWKIKLFSWDKGSWGKACSKLSHHNGIKPAWTWTWSGSQNICKVSSPTLLSGSFFSFSPLCHPETNLLNMRYSAYKLWEWLNGNIAKISSLILQFPKEQFNILRNTFICKLGEKFMSVH